MCVCVCVCVYMCVCVCARARACARVCDLDCLTVVLSLCPVCAFLAQYVCDKATFLCHRASVVDDVDTDLHSLRKHW